MTQTKTQEHQWPPETPNILPAMEIAEYDAKEKRIIEKLGRMTAIAVESEPDTTEVTVDTDETEPELVTVGR